MSVVANSSILTKFTDFVANSSIRTKFTHHSSIQTKFTDFVDNSSFWTKFTHTDSSIRTSSLTSWPTAASGLYVKLGSYKWI